MGRMGHGVIVCDCVLCLRVHLPSTCLQYIYRVHVHVSRIRLTPTHCLTHSWHQQRQLTILLRHALTIGQCVAASWLQMVRAVGSVRSAGLLHGAALRFHFPSVFVVGFGNYRVYDATVRLDGIRRGAGEVRARGAGAAWPVQIHEHHRITTSVDTVPVRLVSPVAGPRGMDL